MAAKTRAELVEELRIAGREISASTIMFHTAVAERLGLSATEEKVLDLLDREGAQTNSQLIEHTGLAPASVTGLIDRLEAKGYVRRQVNPADRRSRLVAAEPGRLGSMAPLFEGWGHDVDALADEFTVEELTAIASYLRRSAARQAAATRALGEIGEPMP
jgi:DNA-binding transcriptional ArsR family regulator